MAKAALKMSSGAIQTSHIVVPFILIANEKNNKST